MLLHFHDYFFPGEHFPLHAMMLNCGQDLNRNRNYLWDGMRRNDGRLVIWQYTLSGRGAIDIDGKTFELGPGKSFLIRVPGRNVYYMPKDSRQWDFIYFTMVGSEVESLADIIASRYGHVLEFSMESPVVTQAIQQIQSPKDESITPYQLSRMAYGFMLSIIEELENSPKRSKTAQLLDRVNAYLTSNLAQPMSVEMLAREIGFSRSHFSRLFHIASGTTIQRYVLETRLSFGVRLLKIDHLSVKEIAARSGFNDANYFCRAFRKKYGVSPEQYRKEKLRG